MPIRILDEQTVNKIAAGEVVESPASVLKELIENSLDAGARHISIEVRSGGFQLLRVSDDGCGMSPQDLQLCVLAHATSKLTQLEDLERIATMGFRGEALASIAAVSRLQLSSKSAQESQAFSLLSLPEGGFELMPAARSQGTSVEVRELFYNVPARKAFQKGVAASRAELTRWIGQLALAYPHVRFSYTYEDQLQLDLPAVSIDCVQSWRGRCEQILGQAFAQQSYLIDTSKQGWQLRGLLGHPLQDRANRTGQEWVINARLVTCPQLSRAVQEGYGTRLAPGRFCQFLLHLQLPAELVDVNVHPQKKELRFRQLDPIAHWIAHSVNLALCGKPMVGSGSSGPSPITEQTSSHSCIPRPTPCWSAAAPQSAPTRSWTFEPTQLNRYQPAKELKAAAPMVFDLSVRPLAIWKRWSLWTAQWLIERLEQRAGGLGAKLDTAQLVWMHAGRALARIRLEQSASLQGQMSSQALLLPLTLEMRLDQIEQISRAFTPLRACGFELTLADRLSLVVHTMPVGMQEAWLSQFFVEVASRLERQQALTASQIASILDPYFEQQTAQGVMAPSELMLGLLNCQQPLYSPSGKPIFRLIFEEDMDAKAAKG